MMDLQKPQHYDFKIHGVRINDDGYNQGGSNVHIVIERWLDYVVNGNDKFCEKGLF